MAMPAAAGSNRTLKPRTTDEEHERNAHPLCQEIAHAEKRQRLAAAQMEARRLELAAEQAQRAEAVEVAPPAQPQQHPALRVFTPPKAGARSPSRAPGRVEPKRQAAKPDATSPVTAPHGAAAAVAATLPQEAPARSFFRRLCRAQVPHVNQHAPAQTDAEAPSSFWSSRLPG